MGPLTQLKQKHNHVYVYIYIYTHQRVSFLALGNPFFRKFKKETNRSWNNPKQKESHQSIGPPLATDRAKSEPILYTHVYLHSCRFWAFWGLKVALGALGVWRLGGGLAISMLIFVKHGSGPMSIPWNPKVDRGHPVTPACLLGKLNGARPQ